MGHISKQIGGNHVAVTSIMFDPNADPHAYEADTNATAVLSKGQLVIENGLGYEDFMNKPLSTSPSPYRQTLNTVDVMQISGQDANPHI